MSKNYYHLFLSLVPGLGPKTYKKLLSNRKSLHFLHYIKLQFDALSVKVKMYRISLYLQIVIEDNVKQRLKQKVIQKSFSL